MIIGLFLACNPELGFLFYHSNVLVDWRNVQFRLKATGETLRLFGFALATSHGAVGCRLIFCWSKGFSNMLYYLIWYTLNICFVLFCFLNQNVTEGGLNYTKLHICSAAAVVLQHFKDYSVLNMRCAQQDCVPASVVIFDPNVLVIIFFPNRGQCKFLR